MSHVPQKYTVHRHLSPQLPCYERRTRGTGGYGQAKTDVLDTRARAILNDLRAQIFRISLSPVAGTRGRRTAPYSPAVEDTACALTHACILQDGTRVNISTQHLHHLFSRLRNTMTQASRRHRRRRRRRRKEQTRGGKGYMAASTKPKSERASPACALEPALLHLRPPGICKRSSQPAASLPPGLYVLSLCASQLAGRRAELRNELARAAACRERKQIPRASPPNVPNAITAHGTVNEAKRSRLDRRARAAPPLPDAASDVVSYASFNPVSRSDSRSKGSRTGKMSKSSSAASSEAATVKGDASHSEAAQLAPSASLRPTVNPSSSKVKTAGCTCLRNSSCALVHVRVPIAQVTS
ncbi:hypothetical protein NUW54_g13138 [Trametes sanguinea]|uniref:Uncharacterized protein n=1 Tax=Trametes sanguinea TaxID=158606 RepID=A0ACC1MNV9_9APHY|nr:hypothetical protein NUW54_g13138 [Trametes sanguinea]